MRYYVMESIGNVLLPVIPKGVEVVAASDLRRFSDIDYDERSELISDRLKQLIELYMPKYEFAPVVYLDAVKKENLIFWKFSPPTYSDYTAVYRNDGIISHITFLNDCAPIVFTARSPKGKRSIVLRMAVAESTLRRSILGLKFTKILESEV